MDTVRIDFSNDYQLLAVPEAAKFLALSERQVRQMIADKKINYVRIGRRVCISLSQLQDFVRAHQH